MPITIRAAQHVFASLTPEQSPTRRRGYQTLFYTREDVSAQIARSIEDRIQSRFPSGQSSKWQFFSLPNEAIVLSHLVAIPEPDEFGRKGRFLAHSLCVSASDWRLLDYSPFGLMRSGSFCRTLDQALTLGNLKSGTVGPVNVQVDPRHQAAAQSRAGQWPPEELWKLTQLTCHALGIAGAGQFVGFVGSEREIIEALEVGFLLHPVPRLSCSFDTFSVGCSWPREVNFWGRGFQTEREARSPFIVNCGARSVRVPATWQPTLTLHERWMEPLIRNNQISNIHKNQHDVFLLSTLLDEDSQQHSHLSGISNSVKNEFARGNAVEIDDRIARLLPKQLPDYLRDTINQRIGRTPQARLDWIIRNRARDDRGNLFFESIREWGEEPSVEIKVAMLPWVKQHAGLRVLFGLWADDAKEIQAGLSMMTSNEYSEYVRKLRQRTSTRPEHFFCSTHLATWFQVFEGRLTLENVYQGIARVALAGTDQDIELLVHLPGQLNTEFLQDIMLWIAEQPFRKRLKLLKLALEQTVHASAQENRGRGDSRGLFGKLRGRR